MTFRDWLDSKYYPGFDPSGLSDEEYYELEGDYIHEISLLDWEEDEDEEDYY